MSNPFPDYDAEPVIDQEVAAGRKTAAQARAAMTPVAAAQAAPPPAAQVMERPNSREEAKARLAVMLGGTVVPAAALAAPVKQDDPEPTEAEPWEYEDPDVQPPPPVEPAAVEGGVSPEAKKIAQAPIVVRKRRPAGHAEPDADRVRRWRSENPDAKRQQDARYRAQKGDAYREKNRKRMAYLRAAKKAAGRRSTL